MSTARAFRIVLALLALGCPHVAAQPQASGGNYRLDRVVIDSGAVSSAASYRVVSSVGQSAVGEADAGNYTARIGFIQPTQPRPDAIFHDGFE